MLEFTWDNVYKIAQTLPRRKCVTLTLYCAELVKPKDKNSQLCVSLIQQFLDNPKLMSERELLDMAHKTIYPTVACAAWTTLYATWETPLLQQ